VPETKDYKPIDIGPAKWIGSVIVARREGNRFIPISGESRVCDWRSDMTRKLEFSGNRGNAAYTVTMDLTRFVRYGNGTLQPDGRLSIQTSGPGWSGNSEGSPPALETLSMEDFGGGNGSLQHSPLSLVPMDDGGNVCLLIHLSRADADDALAQTPADEWLGRQSVAHLRSMNMNSYPGIRHDPNMPPGIRMLAYLGPAAFLLLLAAAGGSLCFRRGRRGPAFAGLTAAMVLYAGWLDSLVLDRRARVMADSSQSDANRILAMSAVPGTFFHAKRATALIKQTPRYEKNPNPSGDHGFQIH
jgi:hypothetical protein